LVFYSSIGNSLTSLISIGYSKHIFFVEVLRLTKHEIHRSRPIIAQGRARATLL